MAFYIAEYVLAGIIVALYLAFVIVLTFKYKNTRDAGFLWLGVTALLWPLLVHWIEHEVAIFFLPKLGESIGYYPFRSFVDRGYVSLRTLVDSLLLVFRIIGAGLFLVTALSFYRKKHIPID